MLLVFAPIIFVVLLINVKKKERERKKNLIKIEENNFFSATFEGKKLRE